MHAQFPMILYYSYLDLLTDEGMNRSILKWLKEFNKDSGTWKEKQTSIASEVKVKSIAKLSTSEFSTKAKEMNEAGQVG